MIRRREIIICTGGGFIYLLCHGLTFLCAGLLSFALPVSQSVWAFVAQPLVAMGLAKLLGPALGAATVGDANELKILLRALTGVPLLLLPLLLVLALRQPQMVPVVSACVFGAHLVALAWLWQQRFLVATGLVIVPACAVMVVALGNGAFHFSGLLAGVAALCCAPLSYRHAAAMAGRAVD